MRNASRETLEKNNFWRNASREGARARAATAKELGDRPLLAPHARGLLAALRARHPPRPRAPALLREGRDVSN